MSKMSELNAQGVTDLHSYTVGFEDGLAYAIILIEQWLDDDDGDLNEYISKMKEEASASNRIH